jgi:hypothetical protein
LRVAPEIHPAQAREQQVLADLEVGVGRGVDQHLVERVVGGAREGEVDGCGLGRHRAVQHTAAARAFVAW